MERIGTIIGGKYRLTHKLGAGAMGDIYAAEQIELRRKVAVKLLAARGDDEQEASERFLREARIAASVQSRFVIGVLDFGTSDDGRSFMVMELLEGETLFDRLSRGPPLSASQIARIVAEALTGLDACHRAGIIHRDVKPENIFLTEDVDGVYPKLLDFGISRTDDTWISGRRLTRDGTIIGTPWYMPPEQVRGQRDIDHRVDLYAMGVILYEALTGFLPFDADNVVDLMVRITQERPIPVAQLRPDLGAEVSAFLERALARRREDRFPDAPAMREALLAIEPDLPDVFTVLIPKAGDPPREVRPELRSELATLAPQMVASTRQPRRSWGWIAAAVAVAILGAAVAMAADEEASASGAVAPGSPAAAAITAAEPAPAPEAARPSPPPLSATPGAAVVSTPAPEPERAGRPRRTEPPPRARREPPLAFRELEF